MKSGGGRRKFSKRGLSPIIASVLLILLVLVLASIVFLWARGFLSEQVEKFGKPIEQVCAEVKFEATLIDSDSSDSKLEIVNVGDVDIFNLDIKKYLGGDSEVEAYPFTVESGKSLVEDVQILMSESGEVPEKIVISPSLLGSIRGKNNINRQYVCDDNGITLNIEEDDV